eukprot:5828256-Prorocentrum_lima.AAC.1
MGDGVPLGASAAVAYRHGLLPRKRQRIAAEPICAEPLPLGGRTDPSNCTSQSWCLWVGRKKLCSARSAVRRMVPG